MTRPFDVLTTAVRAAVGGRRMTWPEDVDAAALAAAADRHGVIVLVDRASSAGDAPAAVKSALRPLVRQRTERALILVRQLRLLLQHLGAEGIEALPVKGPTLAAAAYGDAAMRGASGDLDLIVRPADLQRAVAVLERNGYRREEPWSREDAPEEWKREAHLFPRTAAEGTLVELHTDLRGCAQTPPLPVEAAFDRAVERTLLGTTLRTLSTEDQLLYLSLHAAQHAWSRLIWIADIAALLRQAAPIDWTALLRAAGAIRARMRLAVTLQLAAELLGADVPVEVRTRLPVRIGAKVRMARRRLEGTSAGTPPSRVRWVHDELALRESDAQRLAFLAQLLVPTGLDRSWIALPRPLRWVGWLVRPMRLLARSARGIPMGDRRPGSER